MNIDSRDRIQLGGQITVSVIVIGAFCTVVVLNYFYEVPQGSQRTFDTMVGFLGAAFMAIVGLWTGTTISSQKKDQTIADTAKAAAQVASGNGNGNGTPAMSATINAQVSTPGTPKKAKP